MPRKRPQRQSNDQPDQATLDQWLGQLRAIRDAIRADFRGLTAEQRNRRLKLPSDGVRAMQNVLHVAESSGLTVDAVTPSDVQQRYEQARRLRALAREVDALLFDANSAVMQLESGTWRDVTILYGMLSDLARRKSRVADALAPARAYFKKRRNHKREQKKPKTANGSAA